MIGPANTSHRALLGGLGVCRFAPWSSSGQHLVEVDVTNHAGAVHPEAVRVVEVPFEIPTDGAIEVGSIADTVPLSLPAGSFLLRCEFLQPAGTSGSRARLTFAKKDASRFAVVRAGPDLSFDGKLLTTAEPAPG